MGLRSFIEAPWLHLHLIGAHLVQKQIRIRKRTGFLKDVSGEMKNIKILP